MSEASKPTKTLREAIEELVESAVIMPAQRQQPSFSSWEPTTVIAVPVELWDEFVAAAEDEYARL